MSHSHQHHSPRFFWGVACLLSFSIHLVYCVVWTHAAEVLWVCHVATATLGIGLVTNRLHLAGMGAFCLLIGTPLWFLDVMLGQQLVTTSVFTHVGGFAASVVHLPAIAGVQGVWWRATIGLVGLQSLCRWMTPRHLNINAAFETYPTLAPYFSEYYWYLFALLLTAITLFFSIERLLLNYVSRKESKR